MSYFKFDIGKNPAVEIAEATSGNFATLNGNYSAFADGATYSYTDWAKVTEFVNQADGIGSDTTTVSIDRTRTHGSKENPFVIDSYDKWMTFARENGISHETDATYQYGYGKVWVLAVDITFNTTNQPFLPVWAFGGTFYGLGHTLKNITFNSADIMGTRWQTEAVPLGVFCHGYTGNRYMSDPVVIADLNVDNYSFTNAPVYCGGILGRTVVVRYTYLMNCHAKGSIDRSTAINGQVVWGGIAACSFQDMKPGSATWGCANVAIYRCSADVKMNYNEPNLGSPNAAGGILAYDWVGSNTYIYDCYANVTLVMNGGATVCYGSICGLFPSNNFNSIGGEHIIRECVGKMTINFVNWSNITGTKIASVGSLTTLFTPGDPDGVAKTYLPSKVNITLKNTYTLTNLNWTEETITYLGTGQKVSYYYTPWVGMAGDKTAWYDKYTTMNSSNNNYSTSNAYAMGTMPDYTQQALFTVATGSNFVSTESDLYNKAKTDTLNGDDVLPNKIWENKSSIGKTYSIAASPVKNSKVDPTYKVEYYNLKMNGTQIADEAITGVSNSTYEYGKMTTLTLAGLANATGRQFKGWTTDTAGNAAPVHSMNMVGMNGNLKFYAVWDVTDTSATISTLNDITTAESGGTPIYLQATVNTPTIADPEITYKFLKDGNVVSTATGAANNQYVVDTIAKSGAYSLDYSVYDKQYPLMRHSGTGSTATGASALSITITKKLTKLKRFMLNSTATPAYVGRPLEGLQFQLTMVDANADTEIPGVAVWEVPNSTVKRGTNKANLVFTPANSSAYETMTVEVEFESTDLKLTFNIVEMPTFNFSVNIDYGQAYSAQQIVDMFEAGYVEKINENSAFEESVNNRTPQLNGVDVNKYSAAFDGATELQTINITFTDPKPYDAFLDFGFDNKKENKKIYWNKLIPAPTVSNRGEDWKLVGWFVTKDGEMTETQWDFSSDRVTENVSLTAKWVQIVVTLESVSVSARSTTFIALTELDKLGLTVTATYSSTDSDEPITKSIPFKTGDNDGYEVRVNGAPANALHVGDETIEIWYNGELYETLNITVNPVKLNSSSVNFPACTKDYTGSAQDIDPLTINSLPAGIRDYVLNIEINYYSDNACTQLVEEVIGQGTYYAQATFIMADDDHELAPVKTRFVISPPRTPVTVTWSSASGYTYDGTPQKPVATLSYDGGTVSASQFSYIILDSHNGVSAGIDADTYTVGVVFAESVETIYKFDLGAVTSMRYTIAKAKVAKPVASISTFRYGVENRFVLNGFEDGFMSYSSDSRLSATDVGTYVVRVQLDGNHEWAEGGSVETYTWNIEPQKIARPVFDDVSIEYNSLEQSVVEWLYGFDEEKMNITGDKGTKAGSYTARVTPSSNYTWDNENTPVSVSWTITKRTLYIEWESEDTYEKASKPQYPKIVGFDGLAPEDKFNPDTDASAVRYSGDINKSDVGAYIVKFSSLNTSWASNYEIAEDQGKGFRIIKAGADPDDPNNPQVPDVSGGSGSGANNGSGTNGGGNGNTGGAGGEGDLSGFISTLPQIIISAIALLLIIVFTIMTLNYASAAKAAREKTKRLARVTYSFAPVGLLAVGAFGLSGSVWWAIAGVLAAVALVMAIVAFLFRGKKVKALAMLEEEQERVAEEKELAKEEKAREEQLRRDNEMRMMFASMQQNYQQPQFNYEALQGAIASSVSALLPGLQQMMALPPASGDTNAYNAAHAETELLRAQLAEQQARMEAQMQEQRAYFNQILQNQQAMYEEPEPVDDTSWLGDSDEVVSLEESYGGLGDDEKRFYYEIGSYIMNKPRTSQNDGRYAVLFKYRGRTLFKLGIKNDAPVLYYPSGSGGKNEVRISDNTSLELAKSVIDRQTMKVDSELN